MGTSSDTTQRNLTFWNATAIGVGAIVGGGILALSGVAFSTAGPGAIVAFTLNGLIALITAMSFAELSTRFPESGGTYTYARKTLSVEAAFGVGWVVWFASIVASVLYAIGFASFSIPLIEVLFKTTSGVVPEGLYSRGTMHLIAVSVTLFYASLLLWKSSGGGQWSTIGKVILFSVLIVGGIGICCKRGATGFGPQFVPFLPHGYIGLFQAMGYTFIALQGFDLIAAVAGEIRDPERNVPRAMFMSLATALAIYIPLLFIVTAIGTEAGGSITALGTENPETVIAIAARNYLGPFGFWLVIVAAIMSMISALSANLFAASRIALAMGQDRTLPRSVGIIHFRLGTPVNSIGMSTLLIVAIILLIPNVAAAGAAASLIFLISFTLVQIICILARRRAEKAAPFQLPGYPAVPVIGGVACLSLAIFQGLAVPVAGVITIGWITIGVLLFWFNFSHRAKVFDARTEAFDPQLVRLRGRSPLVLVPIANPANTASMLTVADALTPRNVGRVLLLNVVSMRGDIENEDYHDQLKNPQAVLRASLCESTRSGLAPETLTTIALNPWDEIRRVAQIHRCESLVLGFTSLSSDKINSHLEELLGAVDCDVVVLRAPQGWKLSDTRSVLVPVGGRSGHRELRARLLGSLHRTVSKTINFLQVVSPKTQESARVKVERELSRFAQDEVSGTFTATVVRSDDPISEIVKNAQHNDLVILGLRHTAGNKKAFGEIANRIVRETTGAVVIIDQRD